MTSETVTPPAIPRRRIIRALAAALLALLFGIFLLISCQPQAGYDGKQVGLRNDVVFSLEPGFYGAAIQRILEQRGSPLAEYRETIEGEVVPASEIIWLASQGMDYAVSPKALLVTFSLETGLTWEREGGLYAALQQMARDLAAANVAYQQGARQVTARDGSVIALDARVNAATYALYAYYSRLAKDKTQLDQAVEAWRSAYYDFFPDEKGVLMPTPMPTFQPFMRLPFDNPPNYFYTINSFFDHDLPKNFNNRIIIRPDGRRFDYTGSPCWLGMTCYSGHNAIDYGTPMNTPLYAVADGRITYKNVWNGGIYLDHQNGYMSVYWHMERIDVELDQYVTQGQLLGVSGNRGQSTGPHLHFGVRRTADLVDVDPFGWWSTSPDPWQSLWVWQGDLLADNNEAQTILFYTAYWNVDTAGYGGSSWYTPSVNSLSSSTNWGLWAAWIDQPGEYMVYAYWPQRPDNTTDARYQIFHADGMTVVAKSQRAEGDRWVPLGVFNFNRGPAGVLLTDLTADNPRLQRVYFDAVKWEPVNLRPVYTYIFPLIYASECENPPCGWDGGD